LIKIKKVIEPLGLRFTLLMLRLTDKKMVNLFLIFLLITNTSIGFSFCHKIWKGKTRDAIFALDSSLKDHSETLLHICLRPKDTSGNVKLPEVALQYIRSFPFAAILPVQPLTILPHTQSLGMSLIFLRKKTTEKDVIDGGIEFILQSPGEDCRTIDIIAQRNPNGQTVSKIFSEMLIIKAFVKSVSESHLFTIESVFHKWM
jgi:hypothetical protein